MVLEQELKTYREHHEELLSQYEDEWVLIKGSNIAGTFIDRTDAIRAGYKEFGLVPFLTKQITEYEQPIMMRLIG